MTDTDALTERIARDLWDHDNLHMSAAWRDMAWDDMGGSEPSDERIAYLLRATAVLPIVAEEVRAAKAAALRDAAEDLFYDGDQDVPIEGNALLHSRADEYEAGGSDEHR